MSLAERAGLALLHRIDPERAHALALAALRLGLVPLPRPYVSPRLAVRIAGLDLPNPLGLAAGFDKNAVALAQLLRAGFGFVEVGAITPRPQPGNPRPRLFRLPEARAVINRFGFNNDGADAIARRLARPRPPGIVGINLGANRDSADRAGDYVAVLRICGPHADFATVNVSSPNTAGLRGLQAPGELAALLARVVAARDALPRPIPLFLKIAPDLDAAAIAAIADIALARGIDGIIATNTTVARDGVAGSRHADQAGGLSGPPLAPLARAALAALHAHLGGRLPLIAAGGIDSAGEAFARIRAGASAVQVYTALSYEGLSLVPRILRGLDALLQRNGHATLAEAVGAAAPGTAGAGQASPRSSAG
ncbi:MAG: quinone-dependent dihydroorotate dehydrogenase [Alphaproteobacteria bacterium]|nr:MAG: quinone-dependent dihydroorotate dehydrogenase [Alphaproteobacteria bacterium]